LKRSHTIIYISPDGKTKREFPMSQILFNVVVGALALLFITVIISLIFVGTVYSDAIQKRIYADKVRKMEAEMAKVEKLKQDILYLYDKSEKVKELLGIDIQNAILRSHYDDTRKISIDTMVTKESIVTSQASMPDINPTDGEISRKFSKEHPAIDIATTAGSPVISTIDGIVKSVGWDENFGNYIKNTEQCNLKYFSDILTKCMLKIFKISRRGKLSALWEIPENPQRLTCIMKFLQTLFL